MVLAHAATFGYHQFSKYRSNIFFNKNQRYFSLFLFSSSDDSQEMSPDTANN